MGSTCSLGKVCQSLFYYLCFGSTKEREQEKILLSHQYQTPIRRTGSENTLAHLFFSLSGFLERNRTYSQRQTQKELAASAMELTAPCHLFILHRLNPENDNSTFDIFFSTDKIFSAEGSFTYHRCSPVPLLNAYIWNMEFHAGGGLVFPAC